MSAIGTFRTWRDVRVESAFGYQTEVGLRGCQGSFWTQLGHRPWVFNPVGRVRVAYRPRGSVRPGGQSCRIILKVLFARFRPALNRADMAVRVAATMPLPPSSRAASDGQCMTQTPVLHKVPNQTE